MQNASEITRSTDQDLARIEQWLEEEDRAASAGSCEPGFLCNFRIIRKCHEEGGLLVFHSRDGDAVAFAALSRLGNEIDILETRRDLRGIGIGTRLVNYCIEVFQKREANSVWVDCVPASSVTFWEKQDFQRMPAQPCKQLPACRTLQTPLSMPDDAQIADLRILVLDEAALHNRSLPALAEFAPEAVVSQSGIVHLKQRLVLDPDAFPLPMANDLALAVHHAGREIERAKAKYDEMKVLGVQQDGFGAFYVDQIKLPAPK